MHYRRVFCGLAAAFACALAAVALAAPGRAGDDVAQTRTVSGFERVRLEGAFSAQITAGARRTRVVVSGTRDAIDRVTTEVRDGTLVVGMRGSRAAGRVPRLDIEVAVMRGFANEGAGKVVIAGLAGGDVDLANAGAASIVASGRAAREKITLAGVGKIDAAAVDARDVTVDNDGVGSVYVRASGSLTMNVNGVGEIRYAGNPSHVESHVNGIGRIGRL